MRRAAVAACCAVLVPLSAPPRPAPAPAVLEVRVDGQWHAWWRADSAPGRWSAPHPLVAEAVAWERSAPGVERGELLVSGSGEAWRIRVVLVRLDTALVRLRTHLARNPDGSSAPWSIAAAPAAALAAVNGGQFDHGGPWGWLVEDGAELRPPGRGPLAPALAVDTAGAVRWIPADSVAPVRAALGGAIAYAFQSYPTLLDDDGTLPGAVRAAGLGVDHEHRDARVAIGFDRDGGVLIAITRFAALGEALSRLPFGLTTPEMAAVMGALGCSRAVLLDGGASSQLMVRAGHEARTWPGIRKVPVGLLVLPRTAQPPASAHLRNSSSR